MVRGRMTTEQTGMRAISLHLQGHVSRRPGDTRARSRVARSISGSRFKIMQSEGVADERGSRADRGPRSYVTDSAKRNVAFCVRVNAAQRSHLPHELPCDTKIIFEADGSPCSTLSKFLRIAD